jgi:alpha-D-ribose 1-methylphosphonate 5-phosphate C-P lyase
MNDFSQTPMRDTAYNFAYLDEQTKRMIRRALLKAVAIPGYQVPFGGREMPLPYGWGTGGMQLTAAILGDDDVLKVIDQGRGRHHQRRVDPPFLRPYRGRRND